MDFFVTIDYNCSNDRVLSCYDINNNIVDVEIQLYVELDAESYINIWCKGHCEKRCVDINTQ